MKWSYPLCRLAAACVVILLCVASAQAERWALEDMVGKDRDGRPVFRPKPMDARFRNPISEDDERAFQQRARYVIEEQAKINVPAGNTYFENEKRTYGYLMAQVLSLREDAIADLQLEDAQASEWHRETKGIDFYACFTLKHQTRKYFYFGDLLDGDYRRRMFDGAKAWTAKDPMRRSHYTYQGPGGGWGPDRKNSWVDVRNTENLYLMRVTSVYLFAEATGNREVTQQYKKELQQYAKTLYRVSMGEWDSENYHGHSIGPLCNLYDFARDDEVRMLAKACLDWVYSVGAVKYYRGGFNGPTKRDYNHVQPFGGSAANMLWLHFGDCPTNNSHWESDEVHLITSAYRPPPAVLQLARKRFNKPMELLAGKPQYSATTGGDATSPPEFLETQYFGHSFQMGSLPSGTSEDGGDVNGFKILAYSDKRGANALQCVPGPDPRYVGSPAYQQGKVSGPNRVGQYGNLAIWLVRSGKSPWRWVIPQEVRVSESRGVTFLECDRTWVAIRPLGTSSFRKDDGLTRGVSAGDNPPFPQHQVLAATGSARQFCGLAVEVGEKESYGSFAEFQKKALAAEVDTAKLDEGIVQYKAADGKWLGFHWNDNPHNLGVWRGGKRHDWGRHALCLYCPSDADTRTGPIYSRWGSGTLYVEAGGEAFACTVAEDGKVTFDNGRPDAVRVKLSEEEPLPESSSTPVAVEGMPDGVQVYRDARAAKPGTDSYTVQSDYHRGPVKLEVLVPENYDDSRHYRVLYTLPVNTGIQGNWGCALEEIQRRDLHNRLQLICVAPAYDIDPWLGDLPQRPGAGQPWIRQQAYVTDVIVPFIDAQYVTQAEQSGRYLIGFSKSGIGALSLLLRNLDTFQAVGVYNNADPEPTEQIFRDWGMVNTYGTMDQFRALNPLTLIPQVAGKLRGQPARIAVMAGSNDYDGVNKMLASLEQHQIPLRKQTFPGMGHSWRHDWLDHLVAALMEMDPGSG